MCKVKNEGEATLLLEKLWEYDLDSPEEKLKKYYNKSIKGSINNMKNTWKGIKSIISPQKMTDYSPKIIILGDKTVTDP